MPAPGPSEEVLPATRAEVGALPQTPDTQWHTPRGVWVGAKGRVRGTEGWTGEGTGETPFRYPTHCCTARYRFFLHIVQPLARKQSYTHYDRYNEVGRPSPPSSVLPTPEYVAAYWCHPFSCGPSVQRVERCCNTLSRTLLVPHKPPEPPPRGVSIGVREFEGRALNPVLPG